MANEPLWGYPNVDDDGGDGVYALKYPWYYVFFNYLFTCLFFEFEMWIQENIFFSTTILTKKNKGAKLCNIFVQLQKQNNEAVIKALEMYIRFPRL